MNDDHAHLDMKTKNLCHLPISAVANEANDIGSPLCLSRPAGGERELEAFEKLACMVSKELFLLAHGQSTEKHNQIVSFEGKVGERFDVATTQLSTSTSEKAVSFVVRIFSDASALQLRVDPSELRNRDPRTGDTHDSTGVQERGDFESGNEMVNFHRASGSLKERMLTPQVVEKKGKYGYAVTWSDGATIIYTNHAIARAAGATPIS